MPVKSQQQLKFIYANRNKYKTKKKAPKDKKWLFGEEWTSGVKMKSLPIKVESFSEFNEAQAQTNITKKWYIESSLIPYTIIQKWIDDNPHNNGYAKIFTVMNDDSAYPEMDEFFIDNGLEVGDEVVIHCTW